MSVCLSACLFVCLCMYVCGCSYVSAMVPVKTMKEYELLQDLTVLFCETVDRSVCSWLIYSLDVVQRLKVCIDQKLSIEVFLPR